MRREWEFSNSYDPASEAPWTLHVTARHGVHVDCEFLIESGKMFFGRKWFCRHFSLWSMWYYSRAKKFQAVLQLCHGCYKSLPRILKPVESSVSYLQTESNLVFFVKVQGSVGHLSAGLMSGSEAHVATVGGTRTQVPLTPSATSPEVHWAWERVSEGGAVGAVQSPAISKISL